MKIKSAVLRETKKPITIEELELDPPKEKEVLIKNAFTGFCHSDLSLINGAIVMDLPFARKSPDSHIGPTTSIISISPLRF